MTEGGRKLRNVRAAQAIKAFERLGYVEVRKRGSHHILRHPDKGFLVLPLHRGAIKTGIIMDALKKARISIEQFQKHL